MSFEEFSGFDDESGDIVGALIASGAFDEDAAGDIVGELVASGAFDDEAGASDLDVLMQAAGMESGAARRRVPPALQRFMSSQKRKAALAQAVKRRQLAGFNPTTFKYNPPTYDKARKVPMGFDSGTTIGAGATATITQRPQVPFRPARLMIPSDIAGAILVVDFKVGNKSQLAANGGLPGRMFQEDATDSLLLLDTATPALDVSWIVQNIGGAPLRFIGAASGPAVELPRLSLDASKDPGPGNCPGFFLGAPMYSVRYVFGTSEKEVESQMFAVLFEALIRVNQIIFRENPGLNTSRAKRGPSTPGFLRSALEVVKDGTGSPLDLAAIQCARERISKGNNATIKAVFSGVPSSVRFFTGAFRGDHERSMSNAILGELLEALTRIDMICFSRYPSLPGLYGSGVFYKREPRGEENWQSTLALYRQGFGDCEDLACSLAAEKRIRQGRRVGPGFFYKKRPDGGTLYHIQQMSEAGTLEDDPSARLGMMEHDL